MTKGEVTKVVYVLKRHAKTVKTSLEQNELLDTRFRMTPAEAQDCIAIPVTALPEHISAMILDYGRQVCLYSTAKLGNNKTQLPVANDLTLVQQGLLNYLVEQATFLGAPIDDDDSKGALIKKIQELDVRFCPRKLEFIGDDRTLVIPTHAFDSKKDAIDVTNHDLLWSILAQVHHAPRVVRRGKIDPNSSIRESGHTILWPVPSSETTGPGSSGWITVTEQGVAQSFDLTKVMFSRGNVTEKIRFGKLVQPNEVVLDMYAGIGYYTLPALVKGQARHVYACEWNPHAASALQYNLKANHQDSRATVYIGDSRQSCKENNIVNMVDRVSLGLLPSSEGGWRTAVRALRQDTGGWLHVHANVPVQERSLWTWWLCQSLSDLANSDWIVYCHHVEKVKSFAPTVNHYVADVFCGPRHCAEMDLGEQTIGVRRSDGEWEDIPPAIVRPSCALDQNGVLNQAWMMEEVET
jgi:tRNA G37 N-methylase Trm5